MARTPKYRPTKSARGWVLNVPSQATASGKRERYYYATRAEALEHADKLKASAAQFQGQAAGVSPAFAEEATAARALLAPYGVSLIDAARAYVASQGRKAESMAANEAARVWLESCANLRPNTLTGYKQAARLVVAAFGARLLVDITPAELRAVMLPPNLPSATARARFRNLRVFWLWAAKQKFCRVETMADCEMPKATNQDCEIEILTPEETERLLRTAECYFPRAVATLAIQLFAGVRVEETAKLRANLVSPDGIDLPKDITKKGLRRFITPSATLAAWLRAYPFAPCKNWKNVFSTIRFLAGWEVLPDTTLAPAEVLAAVANDERKPWPQNAMRHSHASYTIAAGAPLESMLFEFGHKGSPELLRQHYLGRASKKDALRYLAILPPGATVETLEAI